jgi:hypothetical protein
MRSGWEGSDWTAGRARGTVLTGQYRAPENDRSNARAHHPPGRIGKARRCA